MSTTTLPDSPVSVKASFPTVAPKCLAQISASCAGVLWTETEEARKECACCSVSRMYLTEGGR